MNRKEMFITISNQSGLSLRRVRKALFERATENKRWHSWIGFCDALEDSSTDWIEYETIEGNERYHMLNTFDVCYFPSGIIVLFRVINYCDGHQSIYGVRLTRTKGLYKTKHRRKE